MTRCAPLRPGVLMVALSLALVFGSSSTARAQETAVKSAPRTEMIAAIMNYAGSGGCDTLRNVFGALLEETCRTPGSGTAVYMLALAALHSQPDQALIEICNRNKLLDCEPRLEVSTGKPVLAFDTSFSVHALDAVGAWSPDGRRLVIYAIGQPNGQTRLIDVERLQFGPVVAEGAPPTAVAWSPDGKYIALNGLRLGPMATSPLGIRLFASDSFEEEGIIASTKEHQCGFATSKHMAFTADSKALWVNCADRSGAPIAIKLRVPGLEVEGQLSPAPPAPDTQYTFQTYAISRNDDLALTGILKPARTVPPDYKQQMAVQSFSLQTKTALHPPILMNLYYGDGDGEASGERTAMSLHFRRDLSAVLIQFPGASFSPPGRTCPAVAELWSTEGRGRLDTGSLVTMIERYLQPNPIGRSGLHLSLRYRANSARLTLAVIDSRSGDTVQEIGPVPPVMNTLVSPDGSRVALIGTRDICFYRVDLNEATAAAGRDP